MSTRCKFTCHSVTDFGETQEVKFTPVVNDSCTENKEFWKWTPSGLLEFHTLNKSIKFFPGKEYYLDISLADE